MDNLCLTKMRRSPASEPHLTDEAGGECRSEASEPTLPPRPIDLQATTRCCVPNTASAPEKVTSGNMTDSRTPLPLRPRGKPFPFILPQPLGPVSPPRRSSQTNSTATRTSAPATPVLIDRYGLPNVSIWGSQRADQGNFGVLAMPHPTPAHAAGLARRTSLGNMTGPGLLTTNHAFPQPNESQYFLQHTAKEWRSPTADTNFPFHRGKHAHCPPEKQQASVPVLDRPSGGSASEAVNYHKCDECHEAFTSSSWLKQHKATHFHRFRCGCGAAYIDKTLLRVSMYSSVYVY